MSSKEEHTDPKADKIPYQTLLINEVAYKTTFSTKFIRRTAYKAKDPKKVLAFIPGKIKKIYIKKGSKVKEDDKLFILEAMKMNNTIFSPIKGTVKEVYVTQGISVAKDALLVEFK